MSDGRGGMIMGPQGPMQPLPGGMTHEDLESRQSLEYDIVMAQHVHQSLIMSADLVKTCSANPAFEKMPDREKNGSAAMLLHADLIAMQVVLLETIRKKMKDCQPFSQRKDLKLRDIREKVDVLMDTGEKSDGTE